MGKTKPKRKGVAGPRAPAARAPTAQQLYEQAQLALQYDDFDSARAALKRAAKLEPSNVEILDALGALLAEVGPEDEALLVSHGSDGQGGCTGWLQYTCTHGLGFFLGGGGSSCWALHCKREANAQCQSRPTAAAKRGGAQAGAALTHYP